jgi:hypothetical protein
MACGTFDDGYLCAFSGQEKLRRVEIKDLGEAARA